MNSNHLVAPAGRFRRRKQLGPSRRVRSRRRSPAADGRPGGVVRGTRLTFSRGEFPLVRSSGAKEAPPLNLPTQSSEAEEELAGAGLPAPLEVPESLTLEVLLELWRRRGRVPRILPKAVHQLWATLLARACAAAVQRTPRAWLGLLALATVVLGDAAGGTLEERLHVALGEGLGPLLQRVMSAKPPEPKPELSPEAGKLRRVARLCAAGEWAAAWDALLGAGIAAGTLDVPAELRTLLQARNEAGEEEDWPEGIRPAEPLRELAPPTEEEVRKFVRSLRRGVGGGPDGLLYEHLQAAATDAHARCALAALFGVVIRGDVDEEGRRALRMVAATPMAKGASLRPILGACVLYRAPAIWAARRASGALASFFLKAGHVAVGIAAAIDAVVHTARAMLLKGHVVAKLDRRNAYGTLDRGATRAALRAVAPALSEMHNLMYGAEVAVLWEGGVVANVECGVIQGDPLAPLYYTATAVRAAAVVAERFKDTVIAFQYLDDTIVIARTLEDAELYAAALEEEERVLGLRYAPAKAEYVAATDGEVRDGGRYRPRVTILVLGTPVGNDAAAMAKLMERAAKSKVALEVLAASDAIGAHAKLYLARAAGAHPRFVSALRTTDPHLAADAARVADDATRGLLGQLAQLGAGEELPVPEQPAWPLALGGLAMAQSALVAAAAFLAGCVGAGRALNPGRPQGRAYSRGGCVCGGEVNARCHANLCSVCCALTNGGSCVQCRVTEIPWVMEFNGAYRALLALSKVAGVDYRSALHAVFAAAVFKKTQMALTRSVLALRRARALSELPLGLAARIQAGGNRLARAWLSGSPGAAKGTMLSARQLRCALRTRLGLQVTPPGPPLCEHPEHTPESLPAHEGPWRDAAARVCSTTGSVWWVHAHDGIRDALYAALRRAGVWAGRESSEPLADSSSAKRPGDVVARLACGMVAIDITRCEIDAAGTTSLVCGKEPDGMRRAHNSKVKKYPDLRPGWTFEPLVLGAPLGNALPCGLRLLRACAEAMSIASEVPLSVAYAQLLAEISCAAMRGLCAHYDGAIHRIAATAARSVPLSRPCGTQHNNDARWRLDTWEGDATGVARLEPRWRTVRALLEAPPRSTAGNTGGAGAGLGHRARAVDVELERERGAENGGGEAEAQEEEEETQVQEEKAETLERAEEAETQERRRRRRRRSGWWRWRRR